MKKRKKREFEASELVKAFAKIHGFENKLLAFEVKDFLKDYLDDSLYNEIEKVDYKDKVIMIKIKSPLLKNDFRMRKQFYLQKFQEIWGINTIEDLAIF